MTALAADANRQQRGESRLFRVPVAATEQIYKGAIVGINATGFAIAAVSGADSFVAGIARENVLGGAADGDEWVTVEYNAQWLFTATAVTQAMLGDTLMLVVDDNTVDDVSAASATVGRITEFISATSVWVYVPGLAI